MSNLSKDLEKAINKVSWYSVEQFEADAKRYISAISENRMFCRIHSVSKSGMSRILSFHEFNIHQQPEGGSKGQILNFYSFFEALGYKFKSGSNGFTVSGCGMDMVFHTNYTIIHKLESIGFVTSKECDVLAQRTPQIV